MYIPSVGDIVKIDHIEYNACKLFYDDMCVSTATIWLVAGITSSLLCRIVDMSGQSYCFVDYRHLILAE